MKVIWSDCNFFFLIMDSVNRKNYCISLFSFSFLKRHPWFVAYVSQTCRLFSLASVCLVAV